MLKFKNDAKYWIYHKIFFVILTAFFSLCVGSIKTTVFSSPDFVEIAILT